MSDTFVCGALAYAPLLEIVLGGGQRDLKRRACELRDYGVFPGRDGTFSILRPVQDCVVPGLLLQGLGPADDARLAYFAGVFGNHLQDASLDLPDGTTVQGQVFFPQNAPDQAPVGPAWSHDIWADKWAAIALRVTTEVMAYFGKNSAEQVILRLPGIRIRALAWVAAQARPADETRDLSRDVVVHAHHFPYANFFAAQEMDLQYRRYDGTLSPVLNRGAQVLGQAVVVLPYDPVLDVVLLVEQFRTPLFIGGDRAPWLSEPVSGLVDPGETPQQTAHRETMEEAGLRLSRLEPVSGVYSSSGATSEFVHLFIGLTDLGDVQEQGGLPGEGEDIRSQVISFDALMAGIDDQQFRDLPLVTTALWLARHRDRLRITA